MTPPELIEQLEAGGVELWVEGDRLRYRGEKDLLTADILSRLKDQKPEFMSLLRERTQRSTLCPVSQGQAALWFLHQLAPESPAYNVGFAARIRSRVDVPAMQRSLQHLVARHASLRTTFPERNGGSGSGDPRRPSRAV